MTSITSETRGRIAIVTIDRAEQRNALTGDMCRELSEALAEAGKRSSVVVLTGAGSAFCAGGDFAELEKMAAMGAEGSSEALYSSFQRLIRTVREVPVPVLAAVNGHAMGAGMDLALACDLRVVSQAAKLGQVWVKVGLVPGTAGAFWVSALAGAGRASEMLLTGDPIDAAQALEWGLVNEIVPPDRVLDRTLELAERISDNPPEALAANKRVINETIRDLYERALEVARAEQGHRFSSDEFARTLEERRKGSG